jgi:hypothetical protein
MNATDIIGWMDPEDLDWIASKAKNSSVVVEIGVWHGRSTFQWCSHSRGIVFAIDQWAPPTMQGAQYDDYPQARKSALSNLDHFIRWGRLLLIEGNSLAVLPRIEMLFKFRAPDILFIDGDHNPEIVRQEIEWGRKMGVLLICGHDYDQVNPALAGINHVVCTKTPNPIWKVS